MKIIIYGTGGAANSAVKMLNEKHEIIVASDSNEKKWGSEFLNIKVISPSDILKYEFDYIVICSMYTKEILQSLVETGVKLDKIIPYFDNLEWEGIQIKHDKIREELFYKKHKQKLALITRRNSGCNAIALYKMKPNNVQVDTDLISFDTFKEKWNHYSHSVSTHFEARFFQTSINIETWHGFPIKTLGKLEKNSVDNLNNLNKRITKIISYSNLYSFIMSSVYEIDIDKFVVTGMPRNDLLQNPHAKELLLELLDEHPTAQKYIFYVPTFRKREDKGEAEGNAISTDLSVFEALNSFCAENDFHLVVKLHPVDCDSIDFTSYSHISLLEEEQLVNLKIDFYEVLGAADLLITDYSSVYFDYLLLNKPIIFWLRDKEVYEEKRGFIFEDIDSYMPGDKVETIEQLKDSIKRNVDCPTLYEQERNSVKNQIHAYKDFNSSKRVWNLIRTTL